MKRFEPSSPVLVKAVTNDGKTICLHEDLAVSQEPRHGLGYLEPEVDYVTFAAVVQTIHSSAVTAALRAANLEAKAARPQDSDHLMREWITSPEADEGGRSPAPDITLLTDLAEAFDQKFNLPMKLAVIREIERLQEIHGEAFIEALPERIREVVSTAYNTEPWQLKS